MKNPTPEPQHPILALHARALACAADFAAKGGSFIEATKPAWQFASAAGLIGSLGSDTVEQIIHAAFALPASSSRWRH
jgi:hypothetical protein